MNEEQHPASKSREPQERAPRLSTEVAVTADSEHHFILGLTSNVSSTGLFIATPIVHPPGTELNLTIQVGKGGSVIRTKAIVRWHRSTNDESEQPMGVGVEFIGMNDTDAARIAAFVKNREQTEAASDDD